MALAGREAPGRRAAAAGECPWRQVPDVPLRARPGDADPGASAGDADPGASVADADAGASVAEFSLVAVLALTITLALLQLAVFLYQRNVVMTALSDGARVAATSGREPSEGREAACNLLDQAIGDRCERITVTVDERDGLIVLTGSGTLPGYLPMVPDLPVRLTARMHDEEDLFGDEDPP